jgi:hypothetical protein
MGRAGFSRPKQLPSTPMEAAMTKPDRKLIALANLITELEPRESAAVSAAIETGAAGLAQARIDAIRDAMDNLLEDMLQLPPPKTMEGLRALGYAIVQRCECEPVFDEPRTLFERSVVALLLGLAGERQ